MARQLQILLIDDIDGSAAEGTIRFGLDGTGYAIGMNARHARQLRDALAAYVNTERRVSGTSRRATRSGRRETASRPDTTQIRE